MSPPDWDERRKPLPLFLAEPNHYTDCNILCNPEGKEVEDTMYNT
jgi:hypothetical protein